MRTDQYIGLNERAAALVEGEQILLYRETITREYPDGRTVTAGPKPVTGSNVRIEKYDDLEGAFGNDFPLFRYVMADGREFYEYVQAEPWSSGPCYFLALRDSRGNPVPESLWTDEEIEANT